MSPIRGSTSSRSPLAVKTTRVLYDLKGPPLIRKLLKAQKSVNLSWDPSNYSDPFDIPRSLTTIVTPDSHLYDSYSRAPAETKIKTKTIDEHIQELVLQMSALDVSIAAAIEEECGEDKMRVEVMAEVGELEREIKRSQDKIRCLEHCRGESEISFVVAGKRHTWCCGGEEFCGDIETREFRGWMSRNAC